MKKYSPILKGIIYVLFRKPIQSEYKEFQLIEGKNLYYKGYCYGSIVNNKFKPYENNPNRLLTHFYKKGKLKIIKTVSFDNIEF